MIEEKPNGKCRYTISGACLNSGQKCLCVWLSLGSEDSTMNTTEPPSLTEVARVLRARAVAMGAESGRAAAAAVNGGAAVGAEPANDPKKKKRVVPADKLHGVRFKTFPDGKSVVEAVQAGMKAHPIDQREGAKLSGLGYNAFSSIRKLLLLRDNWKLPKEDRKIVEHCLERVEKNHRIDAKLAEAVIARNWVKRQDHAHVRQRKQRRFGATLTAIRESCASIEDMELPTDLNREDMIEAIASLSTSVEQIGKLMHKLVVGEKD